MGQGAWMTWINQHMMNLLIQVELLFTGLGLRIIGSLSLSDHIIG